MTSIKNKQEWRVARRAKVTGKCLVCALPLKLTTGQVAYWHKDCRKFRHQSELEIHIERSRIQKRQSIISR